MTIGLFTTTEDPIIWLTVRGVMRAAKAQGITVIIYGGATKKGFSAIDGAQIQRIFCFDKDKHDGFLTAFSETPLNIYAQELWSGGYPVMLIARKHGTVPCARTNNHETICEAVRQLVEKGHRQIAFLMGPETNFSAQERLVGYKEGLKQCEIEFDPKLVLPGDFTEKTAHATIKQALAQGLQFSAILAANDLSAMGILTALRETEIAPGADVEVIGFDNIAATHWTKPPLSSFDPQLYRLGYEACEELLKCIRKEPFEPTIKIPAHFVPRSSTWESSSDVAADRPLMTEWRSHRFNYDTELRHLRAHPHVPTLIEDLQRNLDTPESFMQSFKELLDEVSDQGLSAICLTPILLDLGDKIMSNPAPLHANILLDKVYGMQSAAVLDEQRQRTELAQSYNAHTSNLRELSFSVVKEEQVLSIFRNTIAALGVSYSGVYLYNHPAKLSEPLHTEGKWYGWALNDTLAGKECPPIAVERFDTAFVEKARPRSCWFFLPLMYNEELLGMVILDAGTEYTTNYSDLIRQFSVALNAARMSAALNRANADLVETSRMAGLAEMATGILHNIGNAMNSVNTSCSITADILRKSKIQSVTKVAQLLDEQKANLAQFIENDARGRKLPAFMSQLAEHLQGEQNLALHELDELRSKVEHINQIVAAQQNYAQVSSLVESISPEELLDFALKLSEASLVRHHVNTIRNFSTKAPVKVQRQKAVQILVNLIRNAKESMGEAHRVEKVLTLGISEVGTDRVAISIGDNGKGVVPDNLSRIFAFGYTTKSGGHGFGLHNSALAAREMGGSLRAHSDGLDKGATFILELPRA